LRNEAEINKKNDSEN